MNDASKLIKELSPEQKRALLAELIRKKASKPKVFPVSFGQQRLWFLDQLVPGNPFYNEHSAARLNVPINAPVLERSLNEIVRRHEVLRTTFATQEGEPVQLVAPSLTIELPVVDLRHRAPAEREAEAARLATAEARTPFDLARGPLLRATLLRLGEAEHVFLLSMHHIISDGWSMGIFFRELTALYGAYLSGQPSPLGELPIQYADFAVWQRQWLQGEVLEKQLAYWRQQLAHLPMLQLPTDRPRPSIQSFMGAHFPLSISEGLVPRLESLSREEGATLFMTLLAAFLVLLHRYSGQDDIVVGAPIAGRNRAELEQLIGFFINALVLRADLSGNPTFRQLLKRVREVVLGALEYQDLPFEKLVEELQPERDLSRNPLFQVGFQLFNPTSPASPTAAPVGSAFEVQSGAAKVDLRLDLWKNANELIGRFEYSIDLFDAATIQRIAGHFRTLLEGIVADPDRPIGSLPLLTETERQQILVTWNDTQAEYPQEHCLHQLIEAQAMRFPDSTAVVFDGQRLSYDELNRRANQLAHYLRSLGVGPEALVGICMERSLELIVAFLGVLKAGGAFVPLDPAYPSERLAFMLQDSQVRLLLTQRPLAGELPQGEAQTICLDTDWDLVANGSQENPASGVTPENLAYVIYTSGSTGKPKGVLVEHGGLCNVAATQSRTFGLQPGQRVLQFCSLSFDASIFEFLLALPAGATLCLGTRQSLIPGLELIQLLHRYQVTLALLPPSALATLPFADLPDLKTIAVAGEACPADLVARWAPGRRFFNLYGPTETTIWATVAECKDGNRKPPIGRPIANTRIYVLDRYLNPVPIGVIGEIFIAGVGVARGYLNRPQLTAERFLPDPFQHSPGGRMYRTGDLARFLPDGSLEFLGRVDHQVKIRGFRIELGEIEAITGQHPGVSEVVVAAREDTYGERRLVAYVVARQGTALTAAELRAFLRERLPEFMVPTSIILLDALPLSPNGKIDRQALPSPDAMAYQPARVMVEPQNEMERQIAAVWQEVLNLDQVGREDNFFDIGGHSLLMARVQNKVRELSGKEISMIDMFRYPTISSLARYLAEETVEQISFEQVHDRARQQREAISQQRQSRRERRR